MSDWGLSITVNPPIERTSDALNEIGEKTADWRPCWRRIVPIMKASQQLALSSRGSSLNSPWSPADPRYLRSKIRKGRGSVDLLYSGRLRSRLSGNEVIYEKRSALRFGIRGLKYANAVNWKGRSFLGWSPELRQKCTEEMQRYARENAENILRRLGVV